MLDNIQSMAQMLHEVSVLTSFNAQLYFREMASMATEVRRKRLEIALSAVNSKLSRMAVHLLQNTWSTFTKPCLLEPLRVVIQPYR